MGDNMSLTYPNRKKIRGRVETTSSEIVVFKKGMATRLLFGAVGDTLSNGKETLRLPFDEIAETKRALDFSGQDAYFITLKDGRVFIFTFENPDSSIRALEAELHHRVPEGSAGERRPASKSRKLFGSAALLFVWALLAGVTPLVIGEPFDAAAFTGIFLIAAVVAAIGAVLRWRGK